MVAPPHIPVGTVPMIRVLVADDDPAVLRLWARVLRSAFRVDVLLAEDGASAMARIDDGRIDLVITDYRMPLFTGIDVIAHAHRRRPTLPVVLVSGDLREPLLREAALLGVDEVLAKPFRLEDAILAVRGALAGAGSAAASRFAGEPP